MLWDSFCCDQNNPATARAIATSVLLLSTREKRSEATNPRDSMSSARAEEAPRHASVVRQKDIAIWRERAIRTHRLSLLSQIAREPHNHYGRYPNEISKANAKHFNCEHSTVLAITMLKCKGSSFPNKQSSKCVYSVLTWDGSMEEHNTYCFVGSFLLFFYFLNSLMYEREKGLRNEKFSAHCLNKLTPSKDL